MRVSTRDRRRFVLGCQGLWPGRRRIGPAGILAAVRQSGFIQVDPLNVCARSHDLALHGRVSDYRPADLDQVLFGRRSLFDYGGVVYILPMEELPFWRVHMRRRIADPRWAAFAEANPALLAEVRQQLADRGPLGTRDFAGKNRSGAFRSTKDTSVALYYLWLTGELMTHSRRGFERVYHFRDEIAPAAYRDPATDADADDHFAEKALDIIGLDTGRVWAHRFSHLSHRTVDRAEAVRRLTGLVASGRAAQVEVEGRKDPYFLAAQRLPDLERIVAGEVPRGWRATGPDTTDEVTLLAPLELVSARGRALDLFEFEYLWEVYKPAAKRRWGYYTMPVLYGDRLVARLDPKLDRADGTLSILGLWLEDPADATDEAFLDALAAGIARLAAMAGGLRVELTAVGPPRLRTALRSRVTARMATGVETRP